VDVDEQALTRSASPTGALAGDAVWVRAPHCTTWATEVGYSGALPGPFETHVLSVDFAASLA